MLVTIFSLWPLDIHALRYFFNLHHCWCGADSGFWHFLYVYGIFIGYIPVFLSLLALALSFMNPVKYIAWRKPATFMVLCMVLGPGLLVNAVLKDHWGRPRPRDVVELGGADTYSQAWIIHPTAQGKSFPCGHCSMGFIMAVPFFFLRYRHKKLAFASVAVGLSMGLLIGIARMMAGGHFLSDVLWSGSIVWGVAWLVAQALRLQTPWVHHESERQKKQAKWATSVIVVLFFLLTAGLLVATPYVSSKSYIRATASLRLPVSIHIPEGTVTVTWGDSLSIKYSVYAFGFPNSKMGIGVQESDSLYLSINKTGWFTEVKNNVLITIPDSLRVALRVGKGKILISEKYLNGLSPTNPWQSYYFNATVGQGEIAFTP